MTIVTHGRRPAPLSGRIAELKARHLCERIAETKARRSLFAAPVSALEWACGKPGCIHPSRDAAQAHIDADRTPHADAEPQ